MFRLFAGGLALALVALSSDPGSADDKKEKFTTWVKEVGEVTLTFEIGKETAKYHVTAGDNGVIVTAKLKWDKDTVTSEVTNVEVKGDFAGGPKKGEKVTFKWVVKGDKATLSNFAGDGADAARDVVEGEYKLKK